VAGAAVVTARARVFAARGTALDVWMAYNIRNVFVILTFVSKQDLNESLCIHETNKLRFIYLNG